MTPETNEKRGASTRQWTLVGFFVFSSLFAGGMTRFFLGRGLSPVPPRSGELATAPGAGSGGPLVQTQGQVPGGGSAQRNPASVPRSSRAGLETLEASSPAGKRLAALMAEYQEIQKDPEAMKAFVPKFKAEFADPEKGIRLVKEGLEKLPKLGFGLERMSLLEAAASIPGKQNEAREIAMQELTENLIPARPSAES